MYLGRPREYVEWFNNKFRSTYHHHLFSSMKEDWEVLIYLIEKHNIRTVCEIGTWKGDTVLMLWLHPRITRVKCIDIHKDMGIEYANNISHGLMEKREYGSMFKNTFVELVFADTLKYSRGCEQHDLVFIDGNHDYEHVKNDTELAVSWQPKIIVWHDYGTDNFDIIKYIDELVAKGSKIEKWPASLCVSARLEDIIL